MPTDESTPFAVETDASDFALSTTLNKWGRPVASYSQTLQGSELHQAPVEKEAQEIVEDINKWKHFLLERHFALITDQHSISFIYDTKNFGKIKNEKILHWGMDLASFNYDILHRPGKENTAPDTLTQLYCAAFSSESLLDLHKASLHPGVTRMAPFVQSRNLPYSIEEVKKMTASFSDCAKLKPKYHKPIQAHLLSKQHRHLND